jgi:DNA-binding CsgD family transcriptional regulator
MSVQADLLKLDGLTPREGEVLRLLCKGLPDKVIARHLAISIKTVGAHIDHVYLKLGVKEAALNSRCAAVGQAVARGLVRLSVSAVCLVLCLQLLFADLVVMRPMRGHGVSRVVRGRCDVVA